MANGSPANSASHTLKPPYLHRNWLAAMGANTHLPDRDDDDHRPLKRRRVFENSPDSGIGLEALDAVALNASAEPEKGMRIEVLKIVHKDTARVRTNPFNGPVPLQGNQGFEAKARCRIAISGGGTHGLDYQLLVDSQICTIRTYKNPAGPSRMIRIHLAQPFHIPQDKILVPGMDHVFALAEHYTAKIWLEPAGDPNWPPEFLDSADVVAAGRPNPTPRRQWTFYALIEDLFRCHRKTVSLQMSKAPHSLLPTNYVLDVDVRWSSALSAKTMKRLDKDVRASITCFGEEELMDLDHPDGGNGVDANGHTNGIDGMNGHHVDDHHVDDEGEGELVDDMDDNAEEELTPGRRRRARPQINYNLKLLSDKAQKKERQRQKKQGPRNGDAESPEEYGVTYLLKDKFHMDDYSCLLCGVPPLPNFELLQAHYKLVHDDYAFQYGYHPTRTISLSRNYGRPGAPLSPKVLQIGPPVNGPLSLPAFLEGDDTWVTSRQGSEDGREVGPLRFVGPKSNAPEAEKLIPRGKPKKITVPKTKTTLYHPLSKAPLEPGTQMDRWLPDETWLLRKHRDTLGDYTDITADERDFMQTWDAYFLPLHLSSDLYLPPHYLNFVRDHANWIVAQPTRSIEFSKHMVMLQTRAVIKDSDIIKVMGFLDEARRRLAAGEVQPEVEEREQPVKKNPEAGCVKCGEFVEFGPAWLCCSNTDCAKPLYHDSCAAEDGSPVVDKDTWKCNACR